MTWPLFCHNFSLVPLYQCDSFDSVLQNQGIKYIWLCDELTLSGNATTPEVNSGPDLSGSDTDDLSLALNRPVLPDGCADRNSIFFDYDGTGEQGLAITGDGTTDKLGWADGVLSFSVSVGGLFDPINHVTGSEEIKFFEVTAGFYRDGDDLLLVNDNVQLTSYRKGGGTSYDLEIEVRAGAALPNIFTLDYTSLPFDEFDPVWFQVDVDFSSNYDGFISNRHRYTNTTTTKVYANGVEIFSESSPSTQFSLSTGTGRFAPLGASGIKINRFSDCYSQSIYYDHLKISDVVRANLLDGYNNNFDPPL